MTGTNYLILVSDQVVKWESMSEYVSKFDGEPS